MVEQRVQRRLAAILAADVVGFSRLMEADDAATMTALKARRRDILDPLVAKHQGRIFKTTGDGVMVEFASAVNAVQCAVDLQQGMATANVGESEDRHIILRIGVNLGDIMAEGSDLYGDGVNIAARLEALAEPGSILISGTAHDYVRNKVKARFDDLGPQTLKNIAEPVRVYRAADMPAVTITPPKATTNKPSIAVLPFTNMSDDPDQQYLSDGVTEDIITELSRYHELLVVARNSSFQYRDKSLDMKRVGRELGVEYLVEGSLRKAGNRLRITAQLIEAATGNHLWAEKYDRDIENVFAIQDEVTHTVAATLVGRVAHTGTERARRKPTGQWAAYECVLQAWDLLQRYADIEAALSLVQRALSIDPQYARAHAMLVRYHVEKFWLDGERSALAIALSHAEKALSIDPDDGLCHSAMAYVQISLRNYDVAGLHAATAVAQNPNSALFETHYAYWLWTVGRNSEALNRLDAAAKRDPFKGADFYQNRGYALFDERRYEEAIDALNLVNPKQPWDRMHRAAAYAYLGRDVEARTQVAQLLQANPYYTISWFAKVDERQNPAARERFMAGSRMTGIPE